MTRGRFARQPTYLEGTDQITLLPREDACPCGSPHRRIADVGGRNEDSFWYPDGSFVHYMTYFLPLTDPGLIEYQVHQTPEGADILVVGKPENPERLAADLTAELRNVGLADPRVRIEVVDALDRSGPVGKLERFVPLKGTGPGTR